LIREYVDLILASPLETDVLAVLVLDQFVRGFDFFATHRRLMFLLVLVLDQEVRGFDFLQAIGD
jgi:hypothetical protein